METKTISQLRAEILGLTREYSRRVHRDFRIGQDPLKTPFCSREMVIPYAGRVFDELEVEAAVSSVLDFGLTLGRQGEVFERSLADFLGVRRSILCNSGSSANLLAISSLTSHKLPSEKRIVPGDEVITVAAGFPTTVAPIIQVGATAVFIDANSITGNAFCELLESAYVPGKTKAVMMAHALGNPFDLGVTVAFCKKYDLWLIEDNCDSLGSTYTIPANHEVQKYYPKDARNEDGSLTKLTGSWGDLSTQSFYPPHHITMGEGGAVNIVNHAHLGQLVESFRDWGRDCWCPAGRDNTCNKRFKWQLGELPDGYDHKYTYSHFGYNLKPLDIQPAIGLAQLQKLDSFVEARKNNWQTLRSALSALEKFIDFSLPTHATGWDQDRGFSWDSSGCRTECSWFGFMMLIRPEAPFSRTELAQCLDEKKIGNRSFFGGNLAKQPSFVQLKIDRPEMIRSVGDLTGADDIMNRALFVGIYPGLDTSMLKYMVKSIELFCEEKCRHSSIDPVVNDL